VGRILAGFEAIAIVAGVFTEIGLQLGGVVFLVGGGEHPGGAL
jgi:hypothetical protein